MNKLVYLEDCYTICKVCVLLNCGLTAEDLLDWLFIKKILDEKGIACHQYVEKEYLFTKADMCPKESSVARLVHVVYFTDKGIEWLRSQLKIN